MKITKKLLFLLLCIASVSASCMNEPGTMPNKFEFYSSPNIPLGKNSPKISKSKLKKTLSKVKNPYFYRPLCQVPSLVGIAGLLPMLSFFALGTGWFLLKSYRAR